MPNKERTFWKIANDSWDFDLQRWLDSANLYGICSDDSRWDLKRDRDFPFLGIAHRDSVQIVEGNTITLRGVPNGEGFSHFE